MNTVQVDIVTPEQTVYEGEAVMVIARGVEGDLGIQPGHTPLVTPLKIGVLRVKEENKEQSIAISGGFLEVRPDKVTVLAETAELPADIDVERAKQAKQRAEQRLQELQKEDEEYTEQKEAIERAENRLKLGGRE